MARIIGNLDELADAIAAERDAGRTIALTNGAFDLLHVGHTRSLADAARRADVLVVALNSDASVRAQKGEGRPVNPLAERAEVVAALAAVDYVSWFDGQSCDAVLEAVRPDSDTLEAGDVITGTGHRFLDGSNVLKLEKIVMSDGKEMFLYGSC